MEPTVFQVHKSWRIRATLVLVATGLADCATVWFTQRPILWATLIASSLPVSMIVFVLIPILRQRAGNLNSNRRCEGGVRACADSGARPHRIEKCQSEGPETGKAEENRG